LLSFAFETSKVHFKVQANLLEKWGHWQQMGESMEMVQPKREGQYNPKKNCLASCNTITREPNYTT
jgi:hypothetical protein